METLRKSWNEKGVSRRIELPYERFRSPTPYRATGERVEVGASENPSARREITAAAHSHAGAAQRNAHQSAVGIAGRRRAQRHRRRSRSRSAARTDHVQATER